MRRFLLLFLALGLIVGCAQPLDPMQDPPRDLGSRLAAANLLAGSLASGLDQAAASGAVTPGSNTAAAMLVTLTAIEVALDGAGNAWRANLPQLANANIEAAERQLAGLQMAGLQPMPPSAPPVTGGQ